MSSLCNVVRRRAHKERSQPHDRKKYGFLEKHKDYVLRAQDFRRKEDVIQKLKKKAANRNPDEFYFKMINSKTVDGVHRQPTIAKQYTNEELLLMKTQDIGYILCKAQTEQKKIERLEAALHLLDQGPVNKHTYFAEDRKAAEEMRPVSASKQSHITGHKLPKRIMRLHDGAYKELKERRERAFKLRSIVYTMGLQKQLMLQGKGRKRKLINDEIASTAEAPVFKWHKERKR